MCLGLENVLQAMTYRIDSFKVTSLRLNCPHYVNRETVFSSNMEV